MKKIIIRTGKSLHCYEFINFYVNTYKRSILLKMKDGYITFNDVKYYTIKG